MHTLYDILTYSGIDFDLTNPSPGNISINDIAHALSNLCRFAGHTKEFYSVAQHSVIVSLFCPELFQMHGLLHDAHEAYLGEVITPVKMLIRGYQDLSERLDIAIFTKFGIVARSVTESMITSGIVHNIDSRVFATEAQQLLCVPMDVSFASPFKYAIKPLNPHKAEKLFVGRFEEIKELNNG